MFSLNGDINSEIDDNLSTTSKNKEILHRKLRSENGQSSDKTKRSSYLRGEFLSDSKNSKVVGSLKKTILENFDINDFESVTPDNPLLSINEEENFSKIKYLYHYPFRDINFQNRKDNFKNLKKNDDKKLNDYDSFASLFKKLIQNHKGCPFPCDHLKKFYKRIKFVNRYLSREELTLQKNIIDKLPLFSNEYF
jgi:hypothetical protein